MSITQSKPKGMRLTTGVLFAAAAIVGLGLALISTAKAEGLPNRSKPAAAQPAPPAHPWTGCGVGVFGGMFQGAVDFGGPIQIGSEGTTAGVTGECNWQSGRAVLGAHASYGWTFGDPSTIGINNDLSIGGSAGYLIYPSVLPYMMAAWSRVDTDGGDVDGYKVGGGIKIKMPDAPFILDFRYERGVYSDVLGSGLDATTNVVRAGLIWQFNLFR